MMLYVGILKDIPQNLQDGTSSSKNLFKTEDLS